MKRPYGEDAHTPFSRSMCQQLGLVDLQCILMKDRKTFSALVETIELRLSESVPFKAYFDDGKLRGKCLVAERLGIPFYLFAHREGEEGILRYRVERIPGAKRMEGAPCGRSVFATATSKGYFGRTVWAERGHQQHMVW